MADGWLRDGDGYWAARFHRDHSSWVRDRKLFVDFGRPMPGGEPALLKSRRHLREEDARELWKSLVSSGWKASDPLWGQESEQCA